MSYCGQIWQIYFLVDMVASPVKLIRLLDSVDAHQPVLAGVGLLQVGQVKVLMI